MLLVSYLLLGPRFECKIHFFYSITIYNNFQVSNSILLVTKKLLFQEMSLGLMQYANMLNAIITKQV